MISIGSSITKNWTAYLFLICVTIAAGYGCYLLIAPFLKPILFALVVTVLFYPMYCKIRRAVKNRSVASLLATLTVVFVLAILSALLGRALATGIHEIYDALNASGDGRERLGAYLVDLSERVAEAAGQYIPV